MLTYFLQVNLCWLMFYGLYYALLSRETFFKLNRIYLIISLLAGMILPLVVDWLRIETPLSVVVPMDSIMLPEFVVSLKGKIIPENMLTTEGVALTRQFTWWRVIMGIYSLGVIAVAFRFVIGLIKIVKHISTSKIEYITPYKLVITEGVSQPYSFFNYIFIDKNIAESIDFQNIMRHEKAHANQGHSYDIVFLELLGIAFWCSPLLYLFKRSLRNVHEYLADAAVLRAISKRQYGTLLIQQSQSGFAFALANPFFSQLKKRLIMMTRNPSKRRALIKYTLAFPIFLLLVSFLASPDNKAMLATEKVSDKIANKVDNLTQNTQTTEGVSLNFQDTITAKIPQVLTVLSEKMDNKVTEIGSKSFFMEDNKNQYDIAPSQFVIDDNPVKSTFSYDKTKKHTGFIPPLDTISPMEKLNAIPPDRIKELRVDNEKMRIIVIFKDSKEEVFSFTSEAWERSKNKKQDSKNTLNNDLQESPIYTIVEETPDFPQGQIALFKWLGENIKYPESARKAKVEGTVYIGFVVETDGTISNVTIKRNVPVVIRDTITILEANGMKGNKIVEKTEYSLGTEAERVIKAMPKWIPGRNQGKPVRVAYTLPIKFKLE